MRLLGCALLLLALMGPAHARQHDAMMSADDVLKALAGETIEGEAVPKIIKALHAIVPTLDRDCDRATKLIVQYRGEGARIALIVNDRSCAAVTGPAEGIRRMLLKIQGQPV